MVNALKKNLSPLLAGKYGKLTQYSTRRRHQATNRNSGLVVEMVRAIGVVGSLRSNKMLAAGK
jgi:hypothetical protein